MATYTITARCSNCGKTFTAHVPKGTTRKEWAKKAKCEFCGITGDFSTSSITPRIYSIMKYFSLRFL